MAQLKGSTVYVMEVAMQLAKANVHFEVVYDFNGCILKCRHETTLQAAIDAHKRLTDKH